MTKGDLCPQCHTMESDWVDEDGYPHDVPKYQPVTHRCPGCAEIESLRKTIPDDKQHTTSVLLMRHDEYVKIEAEKAEKAKSGQ